MPDPARTLQNPHLRQCQTLAERNLAEVQSFRQTYDPAQLAWKPEPGTWNMLECIDHLKVMDELYFDQLRPAINAAAAAEHRSEAPFKPSLFGRLFYAFNKPDPTFKIKTFRSFEPGPALTDAKAIDQFITHQQVLFDLIRQAEGLDVNRIKLHSPVSRLVRLSLGEAFWILTAHQQRHLQQARHLTEHDAFPAA